MSVTAIISPPVMTNLFAYFTGENTPVYFPGAPFLTGALLTLVSIVLAVRTLASYEHNPHANQEHHKEVSPEPGRSL
jgi:DHA1 family tetracycline resistance protein-like MFS transporter